MYEDREKRTTLAKIEFVQSDIRKFFRNYWASDKIKDVVAAANEQGAKLRKINIVST